MGTRKIVLIGILLWGACADPRPPSGGPRDDIPPALISTEPPHESVEVFPAELRLTFSEYVDQGSFARAFSMVPTPRGRLQFRWRKRSVTIRLPEELQDSTTYVVTLGDELRDWRGVRLTKPLSFAFATGSVIDQGRISGRVVDRALGVPVAGLIILAYDTYPPGDHAPDYQTQTDTEGRFEFNYVRESDFFVLGLRDLNRNLKPDPGEWFAVPPKIAIIATTDSSDQSPDWVYTEADTLGPVMERVRAISSRLLEIRFNEDVFLTDRTAQSWSLSDSVNQIPVSILSSYQLDSNMRITYLETDSLHEQIYALSTAFSVTDSTGNPVRTDTVYFQGMTVWDARVPNFERFLPASAESPYPLPPWESPQIIFNQPMEHTQLDRLVSVQDSTGVAVDFGIQSSNGTTYSLTSLEDPDQVYRIAVQQSDSTYVGYFRRLGPRSLGSLSGIVIASGDGALVTLTDEEGVPISTISPSSSGEFMFQNLPEKSYRVRAFMDENGNGVWDGGRIDPYESAELISWGTESITIRPRWDTALPDVLRLGTSSTDSYPVINQ